MPHVLGFLWIPWLLAILVAGGGLPRIRTPEVNYGKPLQLGTRTTLCCWAFKEIGRPYPTISMTMEPEVNSFKPSEMQANNKYGTIGGCWGITVEARHDKAKLRCLASYGEGVNTATALGTLVLAIFELEGPTVSGPKQVEARREYSWTCKARISYHNTDERKLDWYVDGHKASGVRCKAQPDGTIAGTQNVPIYNMEATLVKRIPWNAKRVMTLTCKFWHIQFSYGHAPTINKTLRVTVSGASTGRSQGSSEKAHGPSEKEIAMLMLTVMTIKSLLGY